jgi:hypothetical protein
MSIVLGLVPFIVFFVVMRTFSPLAGLAAAFVVSVLLGIRQWRRVANAGGTRGAL